jgi:hypothetical protein
MSNHDADIFLSSNMNIYWYNRIADSPHSGLGQSLSSVVFGRLIAGIGGAGINCLVAIIIAGIFFTVYIPCTRANS